MSLKTLVAFAQQNFASFDGLPTSDSVEDGQVTLIVRPPLPSWLDEATSDQ